MPFDGFSGAFRRNADPDLALVHLERWLSATASPASQFAHLLAVPALTHSFLNLLGASRPLADMLVQNPELASLLLDPASTTQHPTAETIYREGQALLRSNTSYSHSLDRLRFLRQQWTLRIVQRDLAGDWSQPAIWRALSELADGMIRLAAEVAWHAFRQDRSELPETCPVAIVAFGKLGGHELNYSSDIDLVYALPDDLDESAQKLLARYAEALTRAIGDPMGRGRLYRVDLRLRPYGGAGPIAPTLAALRHYYDLYAEPWEIQALLRSRPVFGPESAHRVWHDLVRERAYPAAIGEWTLDELMQNRTRLETHFEPDDLKRGKGGIRDIEFLTQLLQIVHGHANPSLRTPNTLEALRALDNAGLVHHSVAQSLEAAYTFLRKLEHRCQLLDGLQTHRVPDDQLAREKLGRLMGFRNWNELDKALRRHRQTAHLLYTQTLRPAAPSEDRAEVLQKLGPLAIPVTQWFDGLPESQAFYESLRLNESSLRRTLRLLTAAPMLAPLFQNSVSLTEQLLSGEIEEPRTLRFDGLFTLEELEEGPPARLAQAFKQDYAALIAQEALQPHSGPSIPERLSALMDALIEAVQEGLGGDFDILALGSFGRRELTPASDVDLLFLLQSPEAHAQAEKQAQRFLGLFHELRRFDVPLQVDLRLRPEGRAGLLVRTYEGFRAYAQNTMEPWERFALGQARAVSGHPEALRVVREAAYSPGLSAEDLTALVAMKTRIETERVSESERTRHLKLGRGGLGDLEWLVQLARLRYGPGDGVTLPDQIVGLQQAGFFSAQETKALISAHERLLGLRVRLLLLGQKGDVLPSNPDKLEEAARETGFTSGPALEQDYMIMTETVRTLYMTGLERLAR